MQELFDYYFYCKNFLKIRTKVNGVKPLILRTYQKRFMQFWDEIKGPKRIIVVKPRQAGFSTVVASRFFHEMVTNSDYAGIAMADKTDRALAIQKLYTFFLQEIPQVLRPMIETNNTEKLWFDNPKFNEKSKNPGLRSGVKIETALDPNAGRSEPRKFAHLSENAFYRYYTEIDDGVQNSIPLDPITCIIKESTANGRVGVGRPFYQLYNAAKRRESLYKNFFVAWYEIDDYQLAKPREMSLTSFEKELLKKYPITVENLVWRRMKIMEYASDTEETFLTPDERFKQDFPLSDTEAFLHTGQPVFPNEIINPIIESLTKNRPNDLKFRLEVNDHMILQFWKNLKIFTPPRQGNTYFIGADVAEGLSQGDSSSVFILDKNYYQVASWHGKIDPDLFGHLLIGLGKLYNDALLIPECNNMGHTTVTTIKNNGYIKLYRKVVEDKQTKEKETRYGWRTTNVSKNDMINEAISKLREKELVIMDESLAIEMSVITRGTNGTVDLNGKDRVVAMCLALMGRKHYDQTISVNTKKSYFKGDAITGQQAHEMFENQSRKNSSVDIFD